MHVSDRKIHRAFRTHTTTHIPLEIFFIFTICQNYTLALIMSAVETHRPACEFTKVVYFKSMVYFSVHHTVQCSVQVQRYNISPTTWQSGIYVTTFLSIF